MTAIDPADALIAEQLDHTFDLIRNDLKTIKTTLEHHAALYEHRLINLEDNAKDHETRIRSIQKDVTKNNVVYGVSSAASSLLASLALLRTFLVP